jgi:5-methylcytosine-specific restriction protein A
MATSTEWSIAELRGAVNAYLTMLSYEQTNTQYSKTEIRRKALESFLKGRTAGSFEYRMQNISAVLYKANLPYITGYKPAINVGASVLKKISALLTEMQVITPNIYKPTAEEKTLDFQTNILRKKINTKIIPTGNQKPKKTKISSETYIRDPLVRAWILEHSSGICESCGDEAPFHTETSNLPYLEVHHLISLSNNGADSIENAIAVCPNCHRRLHYSIDKTQLKDAIYKKIIRLHH